MLGFIFVMRWNIFSFLTHLKDQLEGQTNKSSNRRNSVSITILPLFPHSTSWSELEKKKFLLLNLVQKHFEKNSKLLNFHSTRNIISYLFISGKLWQLLLGEHYIPPFQFLLSLFFVGMLKFLHLRLNGWRVDFITIMTSTNHQTQKQGQLTLLKLGPHHFGIWLK